MLLAWVEFGGAQLAMPCRVTSLSDGLFQPTSLDRGSQLIFRFLLGVSFRYAQAREFEELRESWWSSEALDSSGVVFGFGPECTGRLVVIEILPPR